jgi:hypothetical protein
MACLPNASVFRWMRTAGLFSGADQSLAEDISLQRGDLLLVAYHGQ